MGQWFMSPQLCPDEVDATSNSACPAPSSYARQRAAHRVVRASATSCTAASASTRLYLTRDGEFHTNQNGILVNSAGYVLVTPAIFVGTSNINWVTGAASTDIRAVYNNLSPAKQRF